MVKRIVKNHELQILNREFRYLEQAGVMTPEQRCELEDLYEVEEGLSFTKTLLYVGSILIGAGILSFVASNWEEIGRVAKFLVIIALFIASTFVGFKMEESYPKTSRSFYYLGVLVFGAGIFLIGQMFHFGGDFQGAFLWWSLGILPLALVLRDKNILLAAAFFVLLYVSDDLYLSGQMIPLWTLLWLGAIYYLNRKIGFSKATAFITGIAALALLGSVISFFLNGQHEFIYGMVYLVIGIALVIAKEKLKDVYVILGYLVHGFAGFFLTFQEAWPVDWIYIPFSILYILFLLTLVKKGSLLSIVILCVIIFRFYIDISFDFLPKSLVFIIGGILLLGFGFYFEKQRKKGGDAHE
ncbi:MULTISPECIES: DUF2157 domain-containing protein [unclassified Bacillus (in: firmicutes)]|uniref:DUF2157 domain-containing protein n=1 Tax=unclassified Bacillus (in: firmicutes) TaxID=185979 RepID=UPI0008EA93FE|nr:MULTISPECIES: DUF2157 domain-containing protein [unclassified Bacillus (in: firmicutes)]SFB07146.1 Uncharacterized membrane protein [Bacillus sp. UNCCL13]SFQ87449.1 Uncharacterized membrane protein [Bacillus sp. cl95]